MEHISKDLVNFQQSTQNQKNFYSDDDKPKSPNEILAEKLVRFNISSLNHTFENYKVTPDTQKAVDTLKGVSSGESNKQLILIYGTTGCGKTHLIEATILAWAIRGIYCRYNTFSDITRLLKKGLKTPGQYDAYFNNYCEATRLVIDDFGMGITESHFEVSDLEYMIDLRYRKRYYPDLELCTILATNKDIKDLPERVVSRFYEPEFGEVIYMGNKDYRRRVK